MAEVNVTLVAGVITESGSAVKSPVNVTLPTGTITESGRLGFPVGIILPTATIYEMGGATTSPYVYVVDSGNNRVNAYSYTGVFQFSFGTAGSGNGQFNNPYQAVTDATYVYVTDRGNHRVQVFTMFGVYVTQFGSNGTGNGEFDTPMGIAVDDRFVWVVDSGNNRFQLFTIDSYAFYYKLGSYGSGTDQFDGPTDCEVDDLFFHITDLGNLRVVHYPKNIQIGWEIDADFPAMTCAIVGSTRSGQIDATFPYPYTSSITGTVNGVAAINADFPRMTSAITALVQITAAINADFPRFSSDIVVTVNATATIDADFPAFTSEFTVLSEITGSIDADFPDMTARIIAMVMSTATPAITGVVLNTINKALSEYSGFPLESFAYFDGKYLATGTVNGEEGIFELTGDDDNGLPIDAVIKTGDVDMHEGGRVRIMDGIHVKLVSEEDMELTLQWNRDSNKTYAKVIPGAADGLPHTRRVKPGRGTNEADHIFNIEIANVNGADFDIDQVIVDAAPRGREQHA